MTLDLLPPALAVVACQGDRHRLRWESGELRALDHDDVDGELALTALGGEPTRCVQIVADWRRAEDDLRVLVLASRGAADPLNPPAPEQFASAGPPTPGHVSGGRVTVGAARPASFGWASYAPLGSAFVSMGSHGGAGQDGPTPDPLFALLQLPGGLPDRLVASVVTAWARQLAEGVAPSSATSALSVALVSRVRLALQSWLGESVEDVDVAMLAPGSAPTIEQADGGVRVRLPFSWLADVWVLGLTHVLGRFTLASRVTEDGVALDTVGTGLDRQPMTIALGG